MRRFINGLIGVTAVTVLAAASSLAGGPLVQKWQITIQGHDRGVMILAFTNNIAINDTIDGYGISVSAMGPFTVNGTWGLDEKGDFTGAYTRNFAFDETADSAQLAAKVIGNGGLRGHANSLNNAQTLKAPAPAPIPDISGTWVAKAIVEHKTVLETFTLIANTNRPGWFDLSGQGVGESGSFTMSGAVIVTSDRHAAGFTLSNFGTATTQAAYSGSLQRNGKRMVLIGKDEDGKATALRATTNP